MCQSTPNQKIITKSNLSGRQFCFGEFEKLGYFQEKEGDIVSIFAQNFDF